MCSPDPAPRGVLITRPAGQADETARRIAEMGFEPVVAPLLHVAYFRITLPRRPVQAIVAASVNAVIGLPADIDRDVTLLAVGDATARRAVAAGFTTVHSANGDARDLAALASRILPRRTLLLLACGRGQGGALDADLRARGFVVVRRAVYGAMPIRQLPVPAYSGLRQRRLRAALFFSAETARTFVRLVEDDCLAAYADTVDALAIGEPAAVALGRLPWRRVAVAAHPDQDALLALLR